MKKIINFVFAFVFAFSWTAIAQESNVNFSKDRRGPDENGVYTIFLDAYVTGNVTVSETPAPADIVLVLDRSGSMAYSLTGGNAQAQNQRINILKTAVKGFVDSVKESNTKIKAEDKDNYGGHRIAFVWFSGRNLNDNDAVYTGISGLNAFQNVENLKTVAASGSGSNYNPAQVNYNGNNLIGVTASGGTIADMGMKRAASILSSQTYSEKRSRIVVFFTDGEPGGWDVYSWQTWMDNPNNLSVANGVINAAKGMKDKGATIYSVGLFQKAEGTRDATTTYLSYTSSDYDNKTEMPANNANNFVAVSGDKSIVVGSADALANVFKNIANASTPNTSAASSSSVLVDIVATSFQIQDDANLGEARVYQVENIQTNATSLPVWEERTLWEDITEKEGITFVSDPETGEVSVSGFPYGEEWCGWDASWTNAQGVRVGKAHGSKIVLEIPIMAAEDAVGGPDIATNAPGSKLIIKDKDGKVVSEHEFISPAISLPVNLHIMKKDLKAGESAKFTIRRTTLPITSTSVWTYVSSVFVTNGESSAFEEYENEDGTTTRYPVTYVRGLPSVIQGTDGSHLEYVYRIEEDSWGWTYEFQKATGIGAISVDEQTGMVTTGPIEITDKNAIYSNKFTENPIVIWNNRETNVDYRVRNAESKATNIFQNGGTVIYVDSKKNTGTGRKD